MADETTRKSLFNRETLLPVGMVATVMLSAIGGTAWLVGAFKDMGHQQERFASEMRSEQERQAIVVRGDIQSLRAEVQSLGQQARLAATDRWHFADMVTWAELLQARNPDLKIPIPQRN